MHLSVIGCSVSSKPRKKEIQLAPDYALLVWGFSCVASSKLTFIMNYLQLMINAILELEKAFMHLSVNGRSASSKP